MYLGNGSPIWGDTLSFITSLQKVVYFSYLWRQAEGHLKVSITVLRYSQESQREDKGKSPALFEVGGKLLVSL